MLKKHFKVIATMLLIVSLIITPLCVAAEYEAILYLREDMAYYTITDGITIGSTYTHNALPEYTPDGKYFVGWFDENGNATNKVTIKAETNLYARYKDYLTDGVAADYTCLETKPELKGVTYVKDGVYGTSVNESGWAYCSWDASYGGAVMGKGFTGSAYGWDPVTKSASTQVADKHNGYIISSENRAIGSVSEVGWNSYSNFILRDKDGYPLVPKANTKYAVTITYELLSEGNITLYVAADRRLTEINEGANAKGVSTYSVNHSNKGLNTKGIKAGEQLTHTYYITTNNFNNSVPMFSIHCQAASFMAERVATAPGSDGNEYASYTVGNATYYPYKIVSTPQVVIRQVAINEIEEGNVVVTYQDYDENIGYSVSVKDGATGSAAQAVYGSSPTPNVWYLSENGQETANTSIFPTYSTTYYSVSHLAAQKDEIKNSNLYFDATNETVVKEGQKVSALKNLKKIRIGNAENGHTYKLSFSLMAQELNDDITLNFASALPWNSDTLKNVIDENHYVIKKDEISADGTSWYDFEYYFTADTLDTNLDCTETGVNYNATSNRANSLFMLLNSDAQNKIYFTNVILTDLGEVISSKGASVLKEQEAQNIGSQAMRFYFDYETKDGKTITLDNKTFNIVERGFIYRKGNMHYYQIEDKNFGANNEKIIKTKTNDLFNCWNYDEENERLTFSTYVLDLNLNDLRKLEVKGYIVIEDTLGKTHMIYSNAVNRTINGVKSAKTDGSNRVLVWTEEFDYYDSISQVSTFNQKYDTMVPSTNNFKTSTDEEHYFVDSNEGELVLRVTSDGNKNYTTAKSVTTRDVFSYQFGYLEMRAKVPHLKGMWPSFWLQPDKSPWNTATYTGEIDIFEVSSDTGFSSNLHKWYRKADGTITNSAIGTKGNFLYGGLRYNFPTTEIANEYHTYGFEWTPEFMAFYVDSQLYCKIDITDETGDYNKDVPGMDCFRNYYYICLNNWVFTSAQSNWMNDRIETLPDFAQNGIDYRIDYIRLYQNSNEKIYIY